VHLECPAKFVSVASIGTGTKGAWYGAREEAYSGIDLFRTCRARHNRFVRGAEVVFAVSCSARDGRAQGDFGLERVNHYEKWCGSPKDPPAFRGDHPRSTAAEWERSMNSKERDPGHSYRPQLILARIPNGPVGALPWSFHFLRSSRRDGQTRVSSRSMAPRNT
jgi:hypothetical protein